VYLALPDGFLGKRRVIGSTNPLGQVPEDVDETGG
jgi:hypothetical protein